MKHRTVMVLLLNASLIPACSGDDGGGVFSSISSGHNQCLCGPVAARNAGTILFNSNVMMEMEPNRFHSFQNFIEQNASNLQADGPTMSCAHKLGKALQSQGLRSFSQKDYDNAYSSVLSKGGTINMASDVASSMSSGAMNAWATGRELVWLSQVIPPAANGNWKPYLNTGTQSRMQFRQAMTIYRTFPGMQRDLPWVMNVIGIFKPIAEEQTVMAACLFRG